MKPWLVGVVVVLLLCSFMGLGVVALMAWAASDRWTQANQDASIATGEKLVDALERYRAATGAYPPNLALLAPAYAADIPAPCAGNPNWVYQTQPGGHFTLTFGANAGYYPCGYYDSRHPEQGWYIDQ